MEQYSSRKSNEGVQGRHGSHCINEENWGQRSYTLQQWDAEARQSTQLAEWLDKVSTND